MTNWELYKLMHTVAGKDIYSGWLKPDDFQTLLQAENIRQMRVSLGLPERYQPGNFQFGPSATRIIETDVVPFLVYSASEAVTTGETNITNWYYINDWYTASSLTPEIISQQEVGNRINHPILTPTTQYPVAIITSKGLKIWPATITSITISYYRKPTTPTFLTTTDQTTGELAYDTTSVELEWADHNKLDIAYRIMQSLGISIERQDMEQYATKLVEGGK